MNQLERMCLSARFEFMVMYGRKGIYEITDHFYKFWCRFVFSNKSYYAMLGVDKAVDEIMEEINDYMGPVFEGICRQYLIRRAKTG